MEKARTPHSQLHLKEKKDPRDADVVVISKSDKKGKANHKLRILKQKKIQGRPMVVKYKF